MTSGLFVWTMCGLEQGVIECGSDFDGSWELLMLPVTEGAIVFLPAAVERAG